MISVVKQVSLLHFDIVKEEAVGEEKNWEGMAYNCSSSVPVPARDCSLAVCDCSSLAFDFESESDDSVPGHDCSSPAFDESVLEHDCSSLASDYWFLQHDCLLLAFDELVLKHGCSSLDE